METLPSDSSKHVITRLSIVIPCFNEERTLRACVERVLEIADELLSLEIVIVDDYSSDRSLALARELENQYPEVSVYSHSYNQGKGAALRTGFGKISGDFVAIQDADLEYRPTDLKRLLEPLIEDEADVVLGSRFLSNGAHRVLYFWHFLGNKFLTLLSNMFTDLNLTDMETCYKVFRREVIDKIIIEENRFGFEPEIVAKVAQQKVRVFEMGISYFGRTYEEGKKIGFKDGLRALYCIIRYNAYNAPVPMQFLIYVLIGGFAAVVNLISFLILYAQDFSISVSALCAFAIAALVNYLLCIKILFRHNARWNSVHEVVIYALLVSVVAYIDFMLTKFFIESGFSPTMAKSFATLLQLILNFAVRRYIVFPERRRGPWRPQLK